MSISIYLADGNCVVVEDLKSIETLDFNNSKKTINASDSFTLNDLNGVANFIGSSTLCLRVTDISYLFIKNN